MTLRTAVIDGEGNLTGEAELDPRVCDCCQTTGVKTEEGVMIVYRDRSEEEIRDLSYVSLDGTEWSSPAKVASDSWKIFGCPVNGPRAATAGKNSAVAWFTGANEQSVVKVAFSDGDGFDEPIVVDDTSPLGRVDILMLDEETAMVSWLDRGDPSTIRYRIIRRDGTTTGPSATGSTETGSRATGPFATASGTIAETDGGRTSGFPQMARSGNAVYFAWTASPSNGETEIRIARMKL